MRFALVLALACVAAFVALDARPARATPPGVGAAVELAQSAPAASIAPAFQMNCDGTAKRVEASAGQSYSEIVVFAGTSGTPPAAVPIFFGGSASMTTATGMPLCNGTSCIAIWGRWPVKGLWCITAGTTIAITAQILQ
jgi:hypothetical protein